MGSQCGGILTCNITPLVDIFSVQKQVALHTDTCTCENNIANAIWIEYRPWRGKKEENDEERRTTHFRCSRMTTLILVSV